MGFFDLFKKKPKVNVRIETMSTDDYEQQANERAKELSRLNENSIRSRNGLTVGEILLLDYCQKGKYPNPQGGYQGFWWFKYGMDDVGNTLKALEERGFIRYATPSELLPTLKANQLRVILKELNLPSKRKKAEMVELIQANADDSFLSNYVKSEKYTLTDLGKQELKENEYIPYMHKHDNYTVTIWDMNKLVHKYPQHRWNDLLWGAFNENKLKHSQIDENYIYRNNQFSMAEFLMDEKRYSDALYKYAEVCFHDIHDSHPYSGYDSPTDFLAPGIIRRMKQCQNETNISYDEMFQKFQQRFERLHTLDRKCSNQDTAGYIVEAIENFNE